MNRLLDIANKDQVGSCLDISILSIRKDLVNGDYFGNLSVYYDRKTAPRSTMIKTRKIQVLEFILNIIHNL